MDTSYRLNFHRAPLRTDANKPLDQVDDLFPGILKNPRLYINPRDVMDVKALQVIKASLLKPSKMVKIYRALPLNALEINPGDWVTTVREYAELHASLCMESGTVFHVISMEVPADHIVNDGNSVLEYGFNPR